MTQEEYEVYVVQPATSEKPLTCENCRSIFINNVEKGLHSVIHNDNKFYECHVCGDFANQSKQAFDIHIREHEGIKKFKCPICSKQFTTFRPAYEHQFLHKKEKPFVCDICQQTFRTSIGARNHKDSAHYELLNGQKNEKLHCKMCNKHYANRSGLDEHNYRHHRELCTRKPVLCDICLRDFPSKSAMRRHKSSHSKEGSFSCQVCSKKLKTKNGLHQHQSAHTGEQKYECN
ncbi:zinc finger protein 19-like [Diabrotica virgifera virgifera]|uniref:C2H2-type domain-containing protein n=1 Tax=Diabrotica virgifera virgifera TaxID=50390 RepID=A0ABM5L351_DIAVI|nr:zinc finger protein 19-like [Diabrotica virgifera virgifera]